MKIIILAGGNGTRLWPISRANYPKQFLTLKGYEHSLFQQAMERSLELVPLEDIYIVTNEKHKFIVAGQIEDLGFQSIEQNILIEPEAKNTLPAITYAVKALDYDKDEIVAVFSSDHLIDDINQFVSTIKEAEVLARDYICLFGVQPNKPHTGYGYIKPGNVINAGYEVAEFKEKPNEDVAREYLDNGYLWNSGMFMFSTKLFLRELKQHNMEVYKAFYENKTEGAFQNTPNISVDYGLLERSAKVAVVPFNVSWSDLGSFDSFCEHYPQDSNGNINFHDEIVLNSHNNLVYTDKDKAVALIGVDDLIIVEEKDALLISKRDQSQQVKMIVEKLKARQDIRTDEHVTTYRPWGSYTILEEGFFYKIKRITVSPDKKLSYQYHHHRSEHWVVVKGTAIVTIEGKDNIVKSGESIYVSLGAKHRLENPGKVKLEVIEIQIGEYLGEDDIVRLDDDFGRSEK